MNFDDLSIFDSSMFEQSKDEPKNVGGRPHLQADNFLTGSFYRLVGVFEEGWYRVGWALTRVREAPELQTLEAVRNAIAPIKDLGQGVICLLVLDTVLDADSKQFQDLRKRLDEAVKAQREAQEAFNIQFDLWREARKAISLATPELTALVMAEKDKRKSDLFRLRNIFREREKSLSDIENDLRSKEAFFAQNETLDFLRQRRHELTPRNLAAALADLPYTHWETSLGRCQKIGCPMIEHVYYSAFRAISYLIDDERPQTAQQAKLFFRESIPALPKEHRQGRDFLVRNWFQYKKSIEQEWDRCPTPRRLPYDLTAALVENLASPLTPLERILAAQEKLEI